MTVTHQITVETSHGPFVITEVGSAIVALSWGKAERENRTALLREAAAQLGAYFDGQRQAFDLPLAPRGSAFQQRVWQAMQAIPFGQVKTYGTLAGEVEGAAQAVGTACGSNPIPIIIPCHRVVAAEGRLGGSSGAGGAKTKLALLKHEGAWGVQGELF